MAPPALSSGVVDSLMRASPNFIFLAFGRRAILGSTTMWQAILYPPIFVRLIDMSLKFLFAWTAVNITSEQKLAAYPHLYSFTSVKSVVHWFQIIRRGRFQMYDDEPAAPWHSISGNGSRYYQVAKFPTRNIRTPILLVYGGKDGLVDISVMRRELPRREGSLAVREIPHYEHLDFLWAGDVAKRVFPVVFEALQRGIDGVAASGTAKDQSLAHSGDLSDNGGTTATDTVRGTDDDTEDFFDGTSNATAQNTADDLIARGARRLSTWFVSADETVDDAKSTLSSDVEGTPKSLSAELEASSSDRVSRSSPTSVNTLHGIRVPPVRPVTGLGLSNGVEGSIEKTESN
jgi:hypothetical protein